MIFGCDFYILLRNLFRFATKIIPRYDSSSMDANSLILSLLDASTLHALASLTREPPSPQSKLVAGLVRKYFNWNSSSFLTAVEDWCTLQYLLPLEEFRVAFGVHGYFGRNRSKSDSFQVQMVTCWHLSGFLNEVRYIPYILLKWSVIFLKSWTSIGHF